MEKEKRPLREWDRVKFIGGEDDSKQEYSLTSKKAKQREGSTSPRNKTYKEPSSKEKERRSKGKSFNYSVNLTI